eukprot:jgi/Chlat1/3399/Chrsp23S03814
MLGFHKRAVVSLSFSPCGRYLASVGLDDDHSVGLYEWGTEALLATWKGDKNRIVHVNWGEWGGIVTTGMKHGTKLAPKMGIISGSGKLQPFYTSAFIGPGQDGAHSLFYVEGVLVTGGSDGCVKMWSTKDWSGWTVSVRSLYAASRDRVLVGTASGEIHEIDTSGKPALLIQGHGEGEVWGVASHPGHRDGASAMVATAGDDGTVRIWDGEKRRLLAAKEMVPRKAWQDIARTSFHTGCVRFVAFSPAGDTLAAGMFNGKEWVSDIKWSPDGAHVAVGTHDNFVDVYECQRDYKRVGICKGHSSFITHMNWSKDGSKLFTNSGDYELLFCKCDLSCSQL